MSSRSNISATALSMAMNTLFEKEFAARVNPDDKELADEAEVSRTIFTAVQSKYAAEKTKLPELIVRVPWAKRDCVNGDLLKPFPVQKFKDLDTQYLMIGDTSTCWSTFINDFKAIARYLKMYELLFSEHDPRFTSNGEQREFSDDEHQLIYEKDDAAQMLLRNCIIKQQRYILYSIYNEQYSEKLVSRAILRRLKAYFCKTDLATMSGKFEDMANRRKPMTMSLTQWIASFMREREEILHADLSLEKVFLLFLLQQFRSDKVLEPAVCALLAGSKENLTLENIEAKLQMAEDESKRQRVIIDASKITENHQEMVEQNSMGHTSNLRHSVQSELRQNPRCINNCGGYHMFWKCMLPLSADLTRKQAEYEKRQKSRRQGNTS